MLDTLEKPGADSKRRDDLLLSTLAAAYAEMEKLEGAIRRRGNGASCIIHCRSIHCLRPWMDRCWPAFSPGLSRRLAAPTRPMRRAIAANDFQLTGGPSFRMVLDVGNWDNSRAVNYPGQSGNPDDPHYRDLTEMWLTGKYFPLLYSRDAVEKATVTRILLKPSPKP